MLRLPKLVSRQISLVARGARRAFRGRPRRKLLSLVRMGNGRVVRVFAVGPGDKDYVKEFCAHYDESKDEVFLTRSVLVGRGRVARMLTSLYVAHELAHAVDRRRVLAATGDSLCDYKKYPEAYFNQPLEFDAEMAAVESVMAPCLFGGRRPNPAMLLIFMLLTTKESLRSWASDKRTWRRFLRRMKAIGGLTQGRKRGIIPMGEAPL